MHLLTILAFAIVYWRAEEGDRWTLVSSGDVLFSLLVTLSLPAVVVLGSAWISRRGVKMLSRPGSDPDAIHDFQHRAIFMLRCSGLAMFGGTVFLTNWPAWCDVNQISPWLQIVGDWVVLSPFMLAMVLLWVVTFSLERSLQQPFTKRQSSSDDSCDESNAESRDECDGAALRIIPYLDFHIRHYLLVVAVPMTIILAAANVTRAYGARIAAWFQSVWAADVILGVVTAGVFVVAPLILKRVWRTDPIEQGAMRDRLEAMCRRIGLRCRDILVWRSGGMMINAAVMGVFGSCRYVLLSDALLEHMSTRQVEAVFGHEAGHICKRHIQQFLVFAFVGWLLVVGIMELLAATAMQWRVSLGLASFGVKSFGVVATVAFWAIGFGMLSRRFERQADLFGARCVTPAAKDCLLPCSVHRNNPTGDVSADRVCATGASVFASALDRVAVLNGIPHEERSWRHSSIASRIRFLTLVAGDPGRAERFEQVLRRVRSALVTVAILGGIAFTYYWITVPQPAVFRLQGIVP